MLGDSVPRETIEQVARTTRRGLRQQAQHPCAIPDNTFRAHSRFAQHPQVKGTVTFRQAFTCHIVDQRQMRELRNHHGVRLGLRRRRRHCLRQRTPDPYLDRCGSQQITSANNLRHTHIQIIDTDGKLIGEQPIGTSYDDIAKLSSQIKTLRTEDHVIEADRARRAAGRRNGNTPGMSAATRKTGMPLSVRQSATGARIHDEPVAFVRRGGGTNIGTRAETRVKQRRLRALTVHGGFRRRVCGVYDIVQRHATQGFNSLLVPVKPRRLVDRFTIPIQPQPAHIIHNPPVGVPYHARSVDILNPQNQFSAAGPHAQPSGERRIRIADMHASGRRWRQTSDNR